MTENFAAFAYLISSVLFIMALRGLSSPETARSGNIFGIVGMVIAVATTLATPGVVSYWMILLGILIGGAIGTFIAWKIEMTSLPELVAAFHSLVGLAAVALLPRRFRTGCLRHRPAGSIGVASLIEMSIGTAIGAVTFTDRSSPCEVAGRDERGADCLPRPACVECLPLGLLMIPGRLVLRCAMARCFGRSRSWPYHRGPDHYPDRWRRHARCNLHAEQLFRLGGLRYRLHFVEHGVDCDRRIGRLLRRNPQLHHVQRDEPVLLQCDLWRFRRRAAGPSEDWVIGLSDPAVRKTRPLF